jgi:amino acid transporter
MIRKMGITAEFSLSDRVIYITMILWTGGWALAFIIGTVYNLANDVSSQEWKHWWAVILGIQAVVAVITAIWFALGGFRDVFQMVRDLKKLDVNELDDGVVHKPAVVAGNAPPEKGIE